MFKSYVEAPLAEVLSLACWDLPSGVCGKKYKRHPPITSYFFSFAHYPTSKQPKHHPLTSFVATNDTIQIDINIMMRQASILIVALAGAIGSVDGFKFMSNWQPPKILTNEQKVEIAKTEERFGDKSECDYGVHLIPSEDDGSFLDSGVITT